MRRDVILIYFNINLIFTFKKILYFYFIFLIIISLILYFSNFIHKAYYKNTNNYEFGSNLIGYNKGFTTNFYILGFLFLLFDAELILFIP